MEIYIKRGAERIGPFSLEEVNRRLAAGSLSPSELAWHETAAGWKPLFSIAGVILPGAASASAMPIGMATPIPPAEPIYAGFWIRAVAFIFDGVILAMFSSFIWLAFARDVVVQGSGNLLLVATTVAALNIFYFAGLWASPMQATFGQKIFGLRVVRDRDDPEVSFSRAIARLLAMALSSLTLGVGYLMAAFTERKRALHDMLAGTCVVKTL